MRESTHLFAINHNTRLIFIYQGNKKHATDLIGESDFAVVLTQLATPGWTATRRAGPYHWSEPQSRKRDEVAQREIARDVIQ
jgi:hypothetical protein